MASGKKGKKTKGKTLALTDFLQETTGSIPIQPIRKATFNWAEEVEDNDGYEAKKPVNVVLPTAPKASRDFDDVSDKVPKDPPFVAYLSNLPYDVDEDEIADFFKDMRIANMRIPKDDRTGESKSKGYGYVEFEDRESLLEALVLRDPTLKSRRMRIEVASNTENDRRRGGRMDMGRGGEGRSDAFGDWRSGGRAPDASERDGGDRRQGGFGRDREGGGGGPFTRDNMRGGESDRGSFTRDNMRGGDSDRGAFTRDNMRSGDRDGGDRGGFSRDNRGGGGFSERGDREGNRSDDRPGAWRDGPSRDQDRDRGSSFNRDRGNYRDSDRGGRFDDREDRRGGGFGPRRYEGDRERDRDRDDGFRRGGGGGGGGGGGAREDAPPSETRERPRLVLAPRTKPVDRPPTTDPVSQTDAPPTASTGGGAWGAAPAAATPSASIFGNARPVDTSQRDREIEEKLERPREEGSRERERGHYADDKKSIDRSSRPPRRIDDQPSHSNRQNRDNRSSSRKDVDDVKPVSRNEEKSPDDKPKREEKRHDKDMPKLADPEPPNFAANNKFAFLQTDDNSD
ncbi:unnamed protein product [Phaedon cochleariae]|uniref:RRM domain-containing protein n=1 Tax=Phaedon cochleariae TaxID=80249 RepID=A0A9P0DMP8_PHACE|nr:unnamed protein product [Phaedon cochleariae]